METISDEMKAQQELDRIYHSIPEWVHRNNPNKSLSEKVKIGFDELTKNFHTEILARGRDRAEHLGMIEYLQKQFNFDSLQMWYNFFRSREKKG